MVHVLDLFSPHTSILFHIIFSKTGVSQKVMQGFVYRYMNVPNRINMVICTLFIIPTIPYVSTPKIWKSDYYDYINDMHSKMWYSWMFVYCYVALKVLVLRKYL